MMLLDLPHRRFLAVLARLVAGFALLRRRNIKHLMCFNIADPNL